MAHDIVDHVSDDVMGQGDSSRPCEQRSRGGDFPQCRYASLDLITLEQAVLLAY